jgi:pimeloyl-ACP methyl ester carboxylesterase
MKFFKYLFLFFLTTYILLCGTLYFAQERIMFFPSTLPDEYRPSNGVDVFIPVGKDIALNAALMTYPNAKGVILYLHGNKGNVQRCIWQSRQFQAMGYDILIPDYRSYGKSGGSLENEAQMYQDMQAVYDYLADRYDHIILLGYSMGTGMASYLAAHNPCQGMVLVAPYVSLVDMKNRYFPFIPNFLLKYQFRTDENLKEVNCPVTLLHGTEDEVIPFNSSEVLHQLFPQTNFVPLQGVGHRRIIFDSAIRRAVGDIIR